MIFGLLYFCVVILCVKRSRSSFILYRIVKRHSRQSNVRRIWTCADNAVKLNRFSFAIEKSVSNGLSPRVSIVKSVSDCGISVMKAQLTSYVFCDLAFC